MSVAYRELIFSLTALIDEAHQDHAVLDRLLRLGQRALGAGGMGVCELDGQADPAGRIVATTGVNSWALGRPIGAEHIRAATPPLAPPYRVDVKRLEPLAAKQFEARSIPCLLMHPVYVDGRLCVLVAAFFDHDMEPDEDQTAVMKLVASAVGFLYRSPRPSKLGPTRDWRTGGSGNSADAELFMAVTSHELRTPVTVIKGYADTLRDHWDQLDDHQRRDSARVIGQRAGELARMVDRLLDASVTVNSVKVDLAPFDLVEALRRASTELPLDLRKRLRLELPAKLPPALGHRAGIGSVLIELVTNAHKYSPGAAPVILTADSDRHTVLFQVADRGIGISPDHTAHTFERFWQGETGDDRRYGGAGLGLFLVRKTIERQNGWVSLRPRDGGGTVAEVRLPRGDIGVGEA
ncbi:MAG TPA: HAMP domain-containing sensor histidine kinase [Candidatus Limnocylindrales bacterium]|nr:HAMP domain-containing sensor histidine kinase [Candidatus Limnocylindrales bacterium]